MKYILRLVAPILGLIVFASCSGDSPVAPGSGYVTPSFHATVESMQSDFRTVFGAGDNDLYAVSNAIMHYDGKRWGTIEPPLFVRDDLRYGLGFPDGSMVVGGFQSMFVRVNGEWNDISEDGLYVDDVWGSAANNIYKMSDSGFQHFDGSTWNKIDLPSEDLDVHAISGNSKGDVVIANHYGRVTRFDGTSWSSAVIDSNIMYDGLAMTESGRVFATRSDRDDVYEITDNTNHLLLRGLILGPEICVDGETLYVEGRLVYDPSFFVIARLENGEWQNVALEKGNVNRFWAGKSGVIAAGWNNFLWRGTRNGGSAEHLFPPLGILTCAANIDGKLIVVGEDAYRYERGTWTSLDKASISRNTPYDIAGRGQDIYAVGDQMIMHYDGTRWAWVNAGFGLSLRTVWVDATGDVWTAGGYGATHMYRLHGQAWSEIDRPFQYEAVLDLWGSDDELFAVGSNGSAAIRKNGVWRSIPTGIKDDLYSVWGFDDNHVYAAGGDSNTLLSWDGRSWHPTVIDAVGKNESLSSVWGVTPNDLFVAYTDGLLHYDGHSWQPLERVFTSGSGGIAGANGEVILLNYLGVASYRR